MKFASILGSPWLNLAVAGLFGMSLAFVAATAWRSTLQRSHGTVPAQSVRLPGPATSPVSTANYRVITQRNLFDAKISDPIQAGTAKETDRPVDLSGLVLLGTISGTMPAALLKNQDTVDLYLLNQQVPEVGRILEIKRNQVVLRLPSGRKVTLTPPEESTTPPAGKATPRTVSRRSTSGAGSYNITSLGENRWLIPRQAAEQVRSNYGTILQQARVVPMIVRGETIGFSIVRPGPLLGQLGLRRGDVLQQVNGIPLDSPGKAMQIFTQLQEARNVSLGLKRGSEQLSFEYEVR